MASSENFDPSWPWRWYSRAECECRCGCGAYVMSPGTMQRADLLRAACGFALPVNSGMRCMAHNSRVSHAGLLVVDGITTWRHNGHALDLQVWGDKAYDVVEKASGMGFTGIGISQLGPTERRFIHVDDLLAPERRTIWSY